MNALAGAGWVLFAAVALGAFGAHGLKNVLTEEAKHWYQTAVLYHMVHGLGMLAAGVLAQARPEMSATARTVNLVFFVGILLFSGSLYVMSVTGLKKLGMITPLGGLAFLAGWALLALNSK